MTDIFREVEDDYRQELLLDFWKRHAGAMIAAIGLIILSAIALAFYQHWQQQQKEQQTTALADAMTIVQDKAADDGIDALTGVISQTTGHQRIAARLALGKLAAQKGDVPAALAAYEAVGNDGAASPAEKGLAQVAALYLQIDTVEPATLSPQLEKLAADASPWRFSAREMQGLLAIRQNNPAEAHRIFDGLSHDSAVPEGIQTRAADLAKLYRGE